MSELAVCVPAFFLEVAHLWDLLLLPGLLLLLLSVLLLPVRLLLDLLMLHLLLTAHSLPPLLNSDTRVEEMTASPGQEPALLTSGTGRCPLFLTTMRDGLKTVESLSFVLRFFVIPKLL